MISAIGRPAGASTGTRLPPRSPITTSTGKKLPLHAIRRQPWHQPGLPIELIAACSRAVALSSDLRSALIRRPPSPIRGGERCPVRLAVRTSASHVENRGSIPLRGAICNHSFSRHFQLLKATATRLILLDCITNCLTIASYPNLFNSLAGWFPKGVSNPCVAVLFAADSDLIFQGDE